MMSRASRGWSGRFAIDDAIGGWAGRLKRSELGEQVAGTVPTRGRRWCEKRNARRIVDVASGQIEDHVGEVHLKDRRGVVAARVPCSAFDQRGSPCRAQVDHPTSPLVCRALLIAAVLSAVIPVRSSNRGDRSMPVSMTVVMPSTVREVSAMLVASVTRLLLGQRALRPAPQQEVSRGAGAPWARQDRIRR